MSALTSVLGTMVALMANSYVHGAVASAVSGLTVGGFLYDALFDCHRVFVTWAAHTGTLQ